MRNLYLSIISLVLLVGCKSEPKQINGYIEAKYQYMAPSTAGVLTKIYVQRGNIVPKNTKLFAIDKTSLKTAALQAGAAIQELEALHNEALKEFARAKKLLAKKAISQSELDQKTTELKTTEAKLASAQQSSIAIKQKIIEAEPVSQKKSYIADTFFSPGEFVAAGQPVVSLYSQLKVRFYIPQSDLTKLKLQQNILVKCDNCKDKIPAKIVYIAQNAEYTPPVIFSKESRAKLVFMVEASFQKNSAALKPGMPVEIELTRP